MEVETERGQSMRPVPRGENSVRMAAREPRAPVTVRYWAGARAAAGVDSDEVAASTVGEALDQVNSLHPGLEPVMSVSSILLDGRPADRGHPLGERAVLEVLPPFAGG